jgi:hypothetical protein
MIRRTLTAIAMCLVVALTSAATAAAQGSGRPPTPEPNFAASVMPRPCALDTKDSYEAAFYKTEGWQAPDYERYPGNCERLRFSYGPIVVKPGQNDVLVGPVTIEKPDRDGYITRFKPNLVRADGTVPPVEQVHLHHGTWLSEPSYGSGPFFAAGEEKTIAPFPKGYGMPIKASDTWLLLYMVHSAVSQPMETYIIYDIDFVPKDKGDALGIKPAYPVWLDVRPSGYPVFNVQRKYGGAGNTCTWPKQECAAFDPYGKPFTGQGKPGNGIGTDLKLPKLGESLGAIDKFTGGTLIGIGGHLHPGGIQNDIDVMRPGGADVQERVAIGSKSKVVYRRVCAKRARSGRCARYRKVAKTRRVCASKSRNRCLRYKRVKVRRKGRTRYRTETKHVDSTRIYNGIAHYWSRTHKGQDGGPPTSWDFSMEVQGLPRWGVHVKPGDVLRSNATYDTSYGASYENMGIAVALLAPDTPDGKPTAPGVDPFGAKWSDAADCGPANGTLCEHGAVTHGPYAENGNYGGPSGTWDAKKGQQTSEVGIANFVYTPGDLSQRSMFGVPQVKLGTNLRFTNAEGVGIYHTVTSCAFPCLGQTGAAFPLPDGKTSSGRQIDLDSAELGIGASAIGAPSGRLDWSVPVTQQNGFKPGETVTYFCRVHPFMRGAFEVTG